MHVILTYHIALGPEAKSTPFGISEVMSLLSGLLTILVAQYVSSAFAVMSTWKSAWKQRLQHRDTKS